MGSVTVTASLTNSNYYISSGGTSKTISITQATGSVSTAPANNGATYASGSYLCTAGSGTGTMYYRIGDSGSFSTTRPTTSGLNAGNYTLYYYAAASSDGNYTQSSTGSITVTVAKKSTNAPVLTAGGTTTYNGTTYYATAKNGSGNPAGTIYYGASSGAITYSLTASSTAANMSSMGRANYGTTTIYAFFRPTDTTNYADSSVATTTVTISNRATGATGVSTSAMTITYSSTTGTRSASGNTGTISATSSNTGVATVSVSGTTITVTRAGYGSATITVTAAQATNYNQATSTFTVNCNRAAISPSVTCANLTYGGSKTTATVSGNSGSGTVTWSSSNTNVATVNSSGEVTPVAAGSVRITASIAQSTNYLAGSAYKDITVNKASLSASVSMSG